MKVLNKILSVVTTVLSIVFFYIGAFLIQVYTAYVVYQSYGWFLGILAFFSPVVPEIIMFVLYLIFYGLFNEYCIIILGYLLCIGFIFLLSYITDKIEKKITEKNDNNKENISWNEYLNNNIPKQGTTTDLKDININNK